MSKIKLGYSITGSFCTINKSLKIMELLSKDYEIIPILSEITATTDTRFGKANDIIKKIESISNNKIIFNILEAEPIGPKNMCDIMIISPCTGNTMAKLALGIVDTCVLMAAKSHLRNSRPLIIAPSTNDALGNAAKNIGELLNYKNIYFVPFSQDNPIKKPRSMVADFDKIPETITKALNNEQIEPIII